MEGSVEKKIGKDRTPNFTKSEVELLMELVVKFKDIIENKKTDRVHWNQKSAAWVTIEKEFNLKSGGACRTPSVLKTKYENIKKTCKQKYAAEKRTFYQTGGGPGEKIKFDNVDEMVSDLLGTQINGFSCLYDADNSINITGMMHINVDSVQNINFLYIDVPNEPGPSSEECTTSTPKNSTSSTENNVEIGTFAL